MLGLWRRISNRLRSGDSAQGSLPFGPGHTPRRITLLKSAAIGDTVLLSAVVRDLRGFFPQAHLSLACGASNVGLARLVGGIDEVIMLPMSRPLAIWRESWRLRSDLFIDFDSWPRVNALVTFCSDSARTVGFRTPGQFRHAVYDVVVDHLPTTHEVENYRNLVRAVLPRDRPALTATPRPWLLNAGGASTTNDIGLAPRYIVFHLFAGGSQRHYKQWPLNHWRALASWCVERGLRVYLSGGLADLTQNEAFSAAFGPGGSVRPLPVSGLAELMTILVAARAVVSVDTGVAHLAGAVGAPTLVLHGPTSPSRWGALGDRVRFAKDEQTPWISLGFEESAAGRPVQLSMEQVRDALSSLIAETETLTSTLDPR